MLFYPLHTNIFISDASDTASRMMGHTNIKTTQIYAKITKEKISQDMEVLSRKLKTFEKQVVERI